MPGGKLLGFVSWRDIPGGESVQWVIYEIATSLPKFFKPNFQVFVFTILHVSKNNRGSNKHIGYAPIFGKISIPDSFDIHNDEVRNVWCTPHRTFCQENICTHELYGAYWEVTRKNPALLQQAHRKPSEFQQAQQAPQPIIRILPTVNVVQ